MKTKDLMLYLRRRYTGQEWAFFENVPNATGSLQTRTADAVAMALWPSLDHAIHGFELKVSRGDWLRELKQPNKATEVQRYCDHWWLVAGDDSVSPHSHDLPSTWGHLVMRHGNLVIARQAPLLTPAPISRGFFAALARKLHKETRA